MWRERRDAQSKHPSRTAGGLGLVVLCYFFFLSSYNKLCFGIGKQIKLQTVSNTDFNKLISI